MKKDEKNIISTTSIFNAFDTIIFKEEKNDKSINTKNFKLGVTKEIRKQIEKDWKKRYSKEYYERYLKGRCQYAYGGIELEDINEKGLIISAIFLNKKKSVNYKIKIIKSV